MSTCGSLPVSWDPEHQWLHFKIGRGLGRILFESTDTPQNVLIIKGKRIGQSTKKMMFKIFK